MLRRYARFWDAATSCTASGYMPDTPSRMINCRITLLNSISWIGTTANSSAQSAGRQPCNRTLQIRAPGVPSGRGRLRLSLDGSANRAEPLARWCGPLRMIAFPLPCPAPPVWGVDWPALTEEFEWIRAMYDCPQDPV